MDKSERETHDFMNVESFSQLPFIRPAPSSIKEKGIRLFGIEFGESHSPETTTTTTTTNNNNASAEHHDSINNKDIISSSNNNNSENNGESSSRRFECHYCCRNFPTSQALGGHQNAHKRERQHAKRAHLQSAMLHSSATFSDPTQVYGLMNYTFNSTTTPTSPIAWNTNSSFTGGGRFFHRTPSYSHHQHPHLHQYQHQHQHQHQHHQPINGSPLGLWRIPTTTTTGSTLQQSGNNNPSFNIERSLQQQNPLPLFSGDEMNNIRATTTTTTTQLPAAPSQNRFVYDSSSSKRNSSSSTNVHDHVSLDLHL